MGVSTDGIVFYGFPVDDDSEACEKIREQDSDGDIDDVVAKAYGWDGKSPRYSFQWLNQNPAPVKVGFHCSVDYPMYYVAITASEVRASRGYPEPFDTSTQMGWKEALVDFCQRLGIKPPEKFGWYVVSMWG